MQRLFWDLGKKSETEINHLLNGDKMIITMCRGTNCDKKEKCMHFTWKDNPNQRYYDVHPLVINEDTGVNECREYWPNERNNPMYD